MEIKFIHGDVYFPKILGGGGVRNPNNPPYLRYCIILLIFNKYSRFTI